MTAWPQILVIIWLTSSIIAATAAAVRPATGRVILNPKQQRVASLAFGAAALSEASLLWAGGFFKGVF